jgi:hypothetical protein
MSAPRVSVSLGRTINLGNFNSLRVEVTIDRDVDLIGKETIHDAVTSVHTEANAELTRIIRVEKN